jgi:hypothetical protein
VSHRELEAVKQRRFMAPRRLGQPLVLAAPSRAALCSTSFRAGAELWACSGRGLSEGSAASQDDLGSVADGLAVFAAAVGAADGDCLE